MIEIERGLRDLAGDVDFPETPDFGPALRKAMTVERIAFRRHSWRQVALVAAATLVVLALAAVAYPPARDGIAKFLHLRGVTIEHRSGITPPTATTTPPQTSPFGEVVTLEAARTSADFKLRIPAVLSTPTTIRLLRAGSQPVVSLEYGPSTNLPDPLHTGIGLLVTEFRGDLIPEFLGKYVGPDTTVEVAAVDGVSGFWLAGAPHAISVGGPESARLGTLRLAENTLVWERDGVTYRIESALSKAEALRVAASLR